MQYALWITWKLTNRPKGPKGPISCRTQGWISKRRPSILLPSFHPPSPWWGIYQAWEDFKYLGYWRWIWSLEGKFEVWRDNWRFSGLNWGLGGLIWGLRAKIKPESADLRPQWLRGGGKGQKDVRKDRRRDVWKFTTSALWGRCPKRNPYWITRKIQIGQHGKFKTKLLKKFNFSIEWQK